MDTSELDYQEEENKRKGVIGSSIFHALLFLLLLFYAIKLPSPPPGQPGILVSFGAPEEGMNDSNPNLLASASEEMEPEYADADLDSEPEDAEPQESEPEPEVTKKSVTKKQPEVLETEDPEAIKLKKAEEDKKKRDRAEKEKAQKKADAKKKVDAKKKSDAKKKADAKKAKRRQMQKRVSTTCSVGEVMEENQAIKEMMEAIQIHQI